MLTTIGELSNDARETLEAFLDRVRVPALVFESSLAGDPTRVREALAGGVDPDEATSGGDPPTAGFRGFPVLARPVRSDGPSRRTPLLLLRKRTKLTSFEDVVTLGRSLSQDLVVAAPSVSKLHACFAKLPAGWRLTDLRSTNGTFVNGERLLAQVATHVPDGAVLQFGADIRARFVLPETLYSLVRSARRDTPAPAASN